MKILVIITLLITTIGFSQDFQGRATYKSLIKIKTSVKYTPQNATSNLFEKTVEVYNKIR